jgi:tetratricopeptide (TPR) repeat protein
MAGKTVGNMSDADDGLVKCANDGCAKKGLHMCARCMVVKYCSAACQKVHWKQGGHKQECTPSSAPKASSAVLATSKPSKAAVAVAGSRDGSEAGACIICLESDLPPIQSGCACRGDAGLAHVECRAMAAAYRMANNNTHEGWQTCATCGQEFTGPMQLGLAEAWWSKVQHLPKEDSQRLTAAVTLARALHAQGKHGRAEIVLVEVLAVQRRVLGPEHPATLLTAGHVAIALKSQGKYTTSEAIYREVFVAQRRKLGPEHPSTLATAANLANALKSQGNYAVSETMHRETLASMRRVLGPEHIHTLSTALNLANSLHDQGKNAEAEQLCHEVLATQRRVLGNEHPSTLTTLNILAMTLEAQGKHTEAESICRTTIAVMRRVLGPEHQYTLGAVGILAVALKSQGKLTEAETLTRETIEVMRKVLGPEHPVTSNIENLTVRVRSARDTSDSVKS